MKKNLQEGKKIFFWVYNVGSFYKDNHRFKMRNRCYNNSRLNSMLWDLPYAQL
jgi:hypothetical protein